MAWQWQHIQCVAFRSVLGFGLVIVLDWCFARCADTSSDSSCARLSTTSTDDEGGGLWAARWFFWNCVLHLKRTRRKLSIGSLLLVSTAGILSCWLLPAPAKSNSDVSCAFRSLSASGLSSGSSTTRRNVAWQFPLDIEVSLCTSIEKRLGTHHVMSSPVFPGHNWPQNVHTVSEEGRGSSKSMLISYSWPGSKQISHGVFKSMSRLDFVACTTKRPSSIIWSPLCLKRTFNTARNASRLFIHSKWIGASRSNASRNMTGFCIKICGGRDFWIFWMALNVWVCCQLAQVRIILVNEKETYIIICFVDSSAASVCSYNDPVCAQDVLRTSNDRSIIFIESAMLHNATVWLLISCS